MMTAGPAMTEPAFESFGGWLKKLRQKPEVEEELDIEATSFQHVFQTKMTDRKKMMEELLQQDNNSDRLNDKP